MSQGRYRDVGLGGAKRARAAVWVHGDLLHGHLVALGSLDFLHEGRSDLAFLRVVVIAGD